MQLTPSALHQQTSSYPYVLISGSYKDDPENDKLCEVLGFRLSKLNIGMISGAGVSGRNVSLSFYAGLVAENKYDPDRIITYFRMKKIDPKRLVDALGSVKFFGNTPTEMRKEMISKVQAVIVIGGNTGTTEEVHLATINNVPVIPIASSGGFAALVHSMYKTNFYSQFIDTCRYDNSGFETLTSNDFHMASGAAVACLKSSIEN